MSEININPERNTTQRKRLNRKLDTVGWGLFFIWMGIALLAGLGWGVGFLGVGLIILGKLVAREYLSDSACFGTTKANC
ncbi:MAG: hypothetical protein C0407_04350 [Desulfobacca sp.]|nr:hypothetical protein [Desulfobacca sp.]